jgi:hypothetical protein
LLKVQQRANDEVVYASNGDVLLLGQVTGHQGGAE